MNNSARAKIRPVILSGGLGKRLWPLSRHNYPKQFAKLLNEESLFLSTLKRVSDRSRHAAPIIVANMDHMPFVVVELALLGITDATVLLEPCGRNTASAAITAALYEKEKDMLHLVLPCDHHVAHERAFHKAVLQGTPAAVNDNIILFCMNPMHPETGYGYIVPGQSIDENDVCRISIFSEKPNQTFATVLIQQGALWNSGMFLYHPALLCNEAEKLAEEHYEKCQAALSHALYEKNCVVLRLEDYVCMESHAFDTLIMERTQCGAVLPCSIGWSDVGSWHSLWQVAEKDGNGNAIKGPVTVKDVDNSYIRSEDVSITALGMRDCIIIAKNNNVLITKRSKAQEVKDLAPVVVIENADHMDVANDFGSRSWGNYKSIAEGKNFRVKQLVIRPGGAISLQAHNQRAEHWIVISGIAKAECNGDITMILPNESAFIPQGAKHRLSNGGDEDLHIVEVQSGDYLGEDDIIRFEDLYGRV